jgi:esterase/lipase superfamily enzyme
VLDLTSPDLKPHAVQKPRVVLVTDRDDEHTSNRATRFGSKRDNDRPLTCGSVRYVAAQNRAMGSSELIQHQLENDLQNRGNGCLSLIEKTIEDQGSSHALFFIHGYRTSAEDAVKTAIALALDVHYLGPVIVWSRPSDAVTADYAVDEETAENIVPRVGMFLSMLLRQESHIKFDLMSHSMGGRVLPQIPTALTSQGRLKIVNSVVFAAPDVAQDIFASELKRAYRESRGEVYKLATLYASDADKALRLSYTIHRAPRAGSAGQEYW